MPPPTQPAAVPDSPPVFSSSTAAGLSVVLGLVEVLVGPLTRRFSGGYWGRYSRCGSTMGDVGTSGNEGGYGGGHGRHLPFELQRGRMGGWLLYLQRR